MDIKIKMAAVIAGLLTVKDKYIFTVCDHAIAVSPLGDTETVNYIVFNKDDFYDCVLSKEQYEKLIDDFNGAA